MQVPNNMQNSVFTPIQPLEQRDFLKSQFSQDKSVDKFDETADEDQFLPFQKIFERAVCLMNQQQWEALIQTCNEGLQIKEDPELYLLKGRALGKLGKQEQKINLIKKAIQMKPNCPAYYRSLGSTQYKLKKYEKALKNHMKSLDLEPNNCLNYHNIGTVLFRLNHYQQSIKYFIKSIHLNKYNAYSYRWLGNCYKEIKEYQKALDCYERAYDIGGKDIDKKEIEKLERMISPWRLLFNSFLIC